MEYCLLVATSLILNVVGPFKSKELARKWAEKNVLKTFLIVPMMVPDE